MKNFLAIDTSCDHLTVVLYKDGEVSFVNDADSYFV